MYDIVTFGNAVIDIFLAIHRATEHCRVDKQTDELCVRYGEKIPLEHCEFLLGGNASNVAVGMSRLGFRTALIAELGGDEFAQKIRAGLLAERVGTEYLHLTPAASSFSIALHFRDERTLFVEHIERRHRFCYETLRTPWLYVTSLGKHWHQAYAEILAFAAQHDIRIAFNPGTPQLQEGIAPILPMLRHADYLFVSRTEAARMLGDAAWSAPTADVLRRLQALGPRAVVMTDGAAGSAAIDEQHALYRRDVVPAQVVEKTGAGDAFAAGCLGAILLGLDLPATLRWGSVNAASVIGRVGSQPGLLDRTAITERAAAMHPADPLAIAASDLAVPAGR